MGNLPKLEKALNAGLDAGLTINEIKEILIHSYAYVGFPRSLNGINNFNNVVDTRKAKGIQDEVGKEATPVPDNFDRTAYGYKVRNSLVGRDISKRTSGYAAFVPTIDLFLVEHLFADIFYRDILNPQERELVTISMLAAMTGTEPQLKGHLGIAMRMGFSNEQFDDYISILDSQVSQDSAARARNVLNNVLGVNSDTMQKEPVIVSKKKDAVTLPADHFTGNATLESLFSSEMPDKYRGGTVNFAAGARTAWHTHPLGQTLIVISGRGFVQSEGDTAQEIVTGDVVWIPANVRHWHGAAPDSPMSHVALSTPLDGSTVKWLEQVSDKDYVK